MSRVCWEPGCGKWIEGGPCWCFDHLRVCDGGLYSKDLCKHPAHDCQEPVHYCEAHGGEPS
jgi:hypothetical protein